MGHPSTLIEPNIVYKSNSACHPFGNHMYTHVNFRVQSRKLDFQLKMTTLNLFDYHYHMVDFPACIELILRHSNKKQTLRSSKTSQTLKGHCMHKEFLAECTCPSSTRPGDWPTIVGILVNTIGGKNKLNKFLELGTHWMMNFMQGKWVQTEGTMKSRISASFK